MLSDIFWFGFAAIYPDYIAQIELINQFKICRIYLKCQYIICLLFLSYKQMLAVLFGVKS